MYVHNGRVINNDLNIIGENMMEEQHNEGSNMYVNNEHRRMNFYVTTLLIIQTSRRKTTPNY